MATLDKIKLSGTTYDIVDSTAIHSMDGYWDSGTTQNAITAATNALAESIAEQGYQTSGDVQNAISGKVDTSTYTAYTAATDSTLSNKADKSEIPSVSGYADSVMYNSTSKYVEFYHGTTAGTKVYEFDAAPFLIDGMVENVEIKTLSSTTVDSGFNSGGWQTSNYSNAATKAVMSGGTNSSEYKTRVYAKFITSQGVETSYVGYVVDNDTTFTSLPSEAGVVKSGNVITITPNSGYKISYIHGDNWKNDSMGMPHASETYSIEVDAPIPVLAITFNTDAGKQEIDIPLSQIFDASNYYTKSETDAKINQAVSGKADASDVQTISGNVNTISGDVATISGDVATLSGTVATKQDTLVSGTNIKTVNNQSILGSGNVDITAGFNVEVSGTTLVFS